MKDKSTELWGSPPLRYHNHCKLVPSMPSGTKAASSVAVKPTLSRTSPRANWTT